MRRLPHTPELEAVARNTVWFKPSAECVDEPLHLVAHVLTYGTHEDVMTLCKYLTDEELREALDHAPPGDLRPAILGLLESETGPLPRLAQIPRRRIPVGPFNVVGRCDLRALAHRIERCGRRTGAKFQISQELTAGRGPDHPYETIPSEAIKVVEAWELGSTWATRSSTSLGPGRRTPRGSSCTGSCVVSAAGDRASTVLVQRGPVLSYNSANI